MNFKGDYEMARQHFAAAVNATPDNAQSHFNLAVVLTSKLGSHAKALKYCKAALKLDPTMHKALHLMGNILQSLGMDAEAEGYFVQAENLARSKSDANQAEQEVTRQPHVLPIRESVINSIYKTDVEGKTYEMICVSEKPLIFHAKGILSEEECEQIVERSRPHLERSFVMGGSGSGSGEGKGKGGDGQEGADVYRSSFNAWLPPDPVLVALQGRLAALTHIPLTYIRQKAEDLQVVKYEVGGQFKVHHDSSAFHPRLLTALVYLNDAPEGGGGETWFPFATGSGVEGVGRGHSGDAVAAMMEGVPGGVEEAIAAALKVHAAHVRVGAHSSPSSAGAHGENPNDKERDIGKGEGDDGGEVGSSEGSAQDEEEEGRVRRLSNVNSVDATAAALPGRRIRPVKGSMILFFNHEVTGAIDPTAVHAGLPLRGFPAVAAALEGVEGAEGVERGQCDDDESVTAKPSGEKWVANYWVELDEQFLRDCHT